LGFFSNSCFPFECVIRENLKRLRAINILRAILYLDKKDIRPDLSGSVSSRARNLNIYFPKPFLGTMAKGKLITFEGIDGSGKTTVAKRVTQDLKEKGYKAIYTYEPTDTWLGDAVKSSYEKDVNPFTEMLLFLADRATHTLQIREWLDNGSIVICDRYADSTYAYQAVALKDELVGLDMEPVDWLIEISRPFVIEPDLTVLLVVEPSAALKRIKRKATKFERERFLEDVQKVYLELAERDSRFTIIDASKSLNETQHRALDLVLSRL